MRSHAGGLLGAGVRNLALEEGDMECAEPSRPWEELIQRGKKQEMRQQAEGTASYHNDIMIITDTDFLNMLTIYQPQGGLRCF